MVSSVWCRSCTKKSKAKTGELNTFLVQPCHPLIYIDSAKPKSGDPDYSKLTWLELVVQWKTLERLDNFKTSDFNELYSWAYNMVMWYWPVDTYSIFERHWGPVKLSLYICTVSLMYTWFSHSMCMWLCTFLTYDSFSGIFSLHCA